MKSKLTIVTVLATISFTGLPIHADERELGFQEQLVQLNKSTKAVEFLAAMQCALNSGIFSQEKVDAITGKYLDKHPY